MMEWIETASPTLKLGATLLSIVALMRLRLPMGGALLAGAVLLGVLFPMPRADFALAARDGLLDPHTATLMAIVCGILIFSSALNKTGQIQRIIDAFRALVGNSRLSLVTFPALIGLLPMPGGAAFSAPMVEAAVADAHLTPARTAAANHWFRHIWEFWFPLYPGVILAIEVTRVPTSTFILLEIPMTLCALAAGYIVILHGIRLGDGQRRPFRREKFHGFLKELVPIFIVVGFVLILDPLVSRLAGGEGAEAPSEFILRAPIVAGLLLAVGWLFWRRGLDWPALRKVAFTKNIAGMMFLILGLMVFKSLLERCGAVGDLRAEFDAQNVPLVLIVCLLPFVTGLVLGISVGFVGASFPLVVALVSGMPAAEQPAWYFLAYVFGYLGMMLSPVHLCLIITARHFKARLARIYAYLLPISLMVAATAALLFMLYRWLAPMLSE